MVRHTPSIVKVEDDMEEMREQRMTSRISRVPNFEENFMVNHIDHSISHDIFNPIVFDNFRDDFQFLDHPWRILTTRHNFHGMIWLDDERQSQPIIRVRTARHSNMGNSSLLSFFCRIDGSQMKYNIQDLKKVVRKDIIQYKAIFEKNVGPEFNANLKNDKIKATQSQRSNWRYINNYLLQKGIITEINHLQHSSCFILSYEIKALQKAIMIRIGQP